MPATQTITKWSKTKVNGKSRGTKVARKVKQVAAKPKRSGAKKSSGRKPAPKRKSR